MLVIENVLRSMLNERAPANCEFPDLVNRYKNECNAEWRRGNNFRDEYQGATKAQRELIDLFRKYQSLSGDHPNNSFPIELGIEFQVAGFAVMADKMVRQLANM